MSVSLKKLSPVAAIVLASSCTNVFAGGEAVWSYEGIRGAEHWGSLASSWGICSEGRYQSPIDINSKTSIPARLGNVEADISATPLVFGLDGPTFAVPYAAGSMLAINGLRYELQQFHFHHPSEHTLNGKHFPMEAHLVLREEGVDHANTVLGVFIEEGSENAMLDQFWGVLPRSSKPDVSSVNVNVGDLLPEKTEYYMYEGSMTTPGCIQGVRWFVMESSVEASKAQIDSFVRDLTQGVINNRPLQPVYGRAVLKGS